MPAIKDICNEAAIQAGDDGMDLYDPQKYLEWANEAAMFLVARTRSEFWHNLLELTSNIVQTEGVSPVDPPTGMIQMLSFTRDGIRGDIWRNAEEFWQVVSTGAAYLKASDDFPQACLVDGKLIVYPAGKTGNSAIVVYYVENIGDDEEADWPLAPELDAAAKAYIAGRAISAESDEEAIRASSAKLEEVGALLPVA